MKLVKNARNRTLHLCKKEAGYISRQSLERKRESLEAEAVHRKNTTF